MADVSLSLREIKDGVERYAKSSDVVGNQTVLTAVLRAILQLLQELTGTEPADGAGPLSAVGDNRRAVDTSQLILFNPEQVSNLDNVSERVAARALGEKVPADGDHVDPPAFPGSSDPDKTFVEGSEGKASTRRK